MPKGDKEHLKADPEDGTTPIANLLLEAIAISYLSSKAKGVLLLLCRKTYGWHKNGIRFKESALSLDDCAKALGIDKRTAQKLLSDLTNNKVLLRSFSRPGYGYIYEINTRVGNWDNSCINHQLLRNLTTDGLNKNSTLQLSKRPTPREANLASPKESIKENINKEDINIDINSLLKPKEAFETWKLVLKELQLQVSKSNYRTWLKGTEGLGYKGGCFVIGVPSGFVAEYLDKNQRSLIEKTLIGITKRKVEVSFVDKKASQAVPCMQGQ